MAITIVTNNPIVETFLPTLREAVGGDYDPYRNHIYRVLTYALHFLASDDPRAVEHIAFALVFHDAGLWTDHELAYLDPSERVAEETRVAAAPHLDARLVRAIIHHHHKFTAYRGPDAAIVNAARKGDWVDATEGKVRHGLTRATIAEVEAAIPVLGFPAVLMRLAADLNHGRKLGGLLRVVANVYQW